MSSSRSSLRSGGAISREDDYQELSVVYLPEKARFGYLLNLPEGADIGKAINEAMKAIEAENEDLQGRPAEDVQQDRQDACWSRC